MAMLKTQRNVYNFFLTAGLLSLNWGIYVYSVQTEQVVAAALGYFIYPLCTVMLGIIVLRRHLTVGPVWLSDLFFLGGGGGR